MDALVRAIVSSVIAIGISALIFLGANQLFDLVIDRWRQYVALVGALAGAVLFGILAGNGSLVGPDILWVVVGAVLVGAVAAAPAFFQVRTAQLLAGTIGGAVVGLFVTFIAAEEILPALDTIGIALFVGIFGVLYVAAAAPFGKFRLAGLLIFATLGWMAGCWLLADIGSGSRLSMAVATIVPAALFGSALGINPVRARSDRDQFQRRLRVAAFLGPALLFVVLGLVIPLARTIYLSLYNQRGEELVGFSNYGEILTNKSSIDLSGWSNIFSSRLFFFGVGLLAAAGLVGYLRGRRHGRVLHGETGSIAPAVAGVLLLSFAVLSSLRGTVINNLWWVVVVTFISTSLGLAAAVLADRTRFESVAKSLIFLPMAISFVGAGIIWRFMYIARPPQKPQTGTLNAIWVGLGKLVPGTLGQIVGIIFLALLTAAMAGLCLFGIRRQRAAIAVGAALSSLPLIWLAYRLIGPGLGGFQEGPLGGTIPQPILFAQEDPFNNFWLMIVLIWIQTGFAMVILSAAIKAVPSELIEAAQVDGATSQQVFFRITLPTIYPTIVVIATALIVLVMKVFDIVRVMTNGNFGTQVIANEMWQRTFTESNLGLGSALAVVLFLGVVPAMALNVRRLQKAKA